MHSNSPKYFPNQTPAYIPWDSIEFTEMALINDLGKFESLVSGVTHCSAQEPKHND